MIDVKILNKYFKKTNKYIIFNMHICNILDDLLKNLKKLKIFGCILKKI
jgi:hypothetical protein